MVLSRQIVSDGLLDELDRFGALVGSLTDEQWSTASRCDGWAVSDVAAHLIGTLADIAAGRFDGLGTPEVTQREVDERRGRAPKELADECAEVRAATAGLLPLFDDAAWDGPAPGGYNGSVGEAVEAIWYDAFLHADDIRAAVGLPSELGPGLAAARSHVGEILTAEHAWSGEMPAADDAAMELILEATGRGPAVGSEPLPNIYA